MVPDNYHVITAATDCAISYYWSPFEENEGPTFDFLNITAYTGVDEDARIAYIIFRGTDSGWDWLWNLACVPLPLFHPTAHAGFLVGWKMAKKKIERWLDDNQDRYDEIITTGHSLGGGLATVCAYDLAKQNRPLNRCVTIGAPRVYWFTSTSRVNKTLGDKIFRYTHRHDRVPNLPPRLLGYRHVGSLWQKPLPLPIPEPIPPGVDRVIEKAYKYLGIGFLAGLEEKYNVPMSLSIPLIMAFVLAPISKALPWVTTSYFFVLYALFAVVILITIFLGAFKALQAHKSAIYAGERGSKNALAKLAFRGFGRLSIHQTVVRDGKEYLAFVLPDVPDDPDQAKRFVKTVGSIFPLEDISRNMVNVGGLFFQHRDPAVSHARSYQLAAVTLKCLGYSDEEIERFPEIYKTNDKFLRPSHWQRDYGILNIGNARLSDKDSA